MKGSSTIITAPDGIWLYEGGGVGLATSGSGDVLAGIIAGLAARGAVPTAAALWGVYLHGEAGGRLSQIIGPLGFLAREIPDMIPKLLIQMQ
jgi:NAD(P)H-hydrate repair Nnr-like enzyme with NAD(P)H-hydrate dehydratase domain